MSTYLPEILSYFQQLTLFGTNSSDVYSKFVYCTKLVSDQVINYTKNDT